MHDAGACGHPLHVARAKHAAMAGRVLVLELALQHVSDGLEAAMRVIGRADRFAGAVIGRPHLVEKEEGIDCVQSRGRHWPAHDEACAFALTVRGDDPGGFADGARARCHGFLLPKRGIWGRMVREQAPGSPLSRARRRDSWLLIHIPALPKARSRHILYVITVTLGGQPTKPKPSTPYIVMAP